MNRPRVVILTILGIYSYNNLAKIKGISLTYKVVVKGTVAVGTRCDRELIFNTVFQL